MTSLQKDKNVMNNDATRAQVLRASVAGTIACAFVGAGALTVFSPTLPAAQAAEVDVVTGVVMANSSHPHGPNYVWDNYVMDFSFDTSGKAVTEGDTITIQLPSELRTRATHFDVDDKNGGGTALNCAIPAGEGQSLSCVFTDYAKRHVNMKGDIHVLADMTRESTSDSFSFTINHTVTLTTTVPNGNIVRNTTGYAPVDPYKYGWQLHDGHNDRFTWEIYLPERNITSNTINITDTFDTSHGGYKLFNDPAPNAWQQTRLYKWNSLADFKADVNHQHPAQSVKIGGSVNGGTFTLTETADGFVASFPNSNSDAYYLLKYYTELKIPGSATVGTSFKNTAVVNGKSTERTIAIETVGWGELEGQFKTTPPTPSVTTPPTTVPSPSESTTVPSPSVSMTLPPKKSLAHTGVNAAPAIGLGALGLALGVALMRRRQQA